MKTPPAMAAPHFSPGQIENEAVTVAKAVARQIAMARRAGQNPALGERLGTHLLDSMTFPPGAVIAGFWPMSDEIDIRLLLGRLHDRGHGIGLPVTGGRRQALVFRSWQPGATLLPGPFGTSHPAGAEVTPDVLLMPLLAFDRHGNRLGYGGGYYDRTIAQLPQALRIGCAFACQELDSVPTGPYDQRLHAIATEIGLRHFPTAGIPGP